MRCSMECPLICFHDVELWAENSSDLVCITVVHVIPGWSIVSIRLLSWHQNSVEGRYASTCNLGHIHVVFHVATEQLRREVGIRRDLRRLRKVSSSIVRKLYVAISVTTCRCPPVWMCDIKSLFLAVNCNIYCGETLD